MRVVGYLRVSTDRQAEEGLGLAVQEQSIRSWARAEGHSITSMYRDEGLSGSNGIETRVGLGGALNALRDAKAEGLVVYRLDRLARDLVLQEQLLAEVRRMGGRVFSTSLAETGYLDDDPDDPSRKLIRQVLGAVSEYERSMITLRLRSGRSRKAQEGGYAGGRPPLGFRAEGRELVRDEQEQAAIERIMDLHAAGASLRSIAQTLSTEGFATRRGGQWHSMTVGRVLERCKGSRATSTPRS